LVFEGEYLNHRRNGKGKEYNSEEKLMFEGEFREGKKWNGKGYNPQGKVEYEIKKGNGKVKEYHDGRLVFEGEKEVGKEGNMILFLEM
jgi:antitoxin component YwqK of YwqJK toxin-antitoxin module